MSSKKLLALLVGSGLSLGSANAGELDRFEEFLSSDTSVTLVENIGEDIDPYDNHNGCCGGSTCNGSCK